MSAEGKKEIELEIAHVLFIDIVGYSKLSINEQRAVQAGNPQAALSGMQRACELDPRNPQYLRWLGDVYVK
jgi:hypothetical protein